MKTPAAVTKAIGADTKSSATAANATANTSNDSQKLLLEELSKPGTPQVEIEVKSGRKRGGSGKGSGKGKGKQRAKNKR